MQNHIQQGQANETIFSMLSSPELKTTFFNKNCEICKQLVSKTVMLFEPFFVFKNCDASCKLLLLFSFKNYTMPNTALIQIELHK